MLYQFALSTSLTLGKENIKFRSFFDFITSSQKYLLKVQCLLFSLHKICIIIMLAKNKN